MRHITLRDVSIAAQPGRPRTIQLANMPQLQHLELPTYEDDVWQEGLVQTNQITTAEASFLTSSSQLTHLSLGHDFGSMDASCYSLMFTPR